MAHLKLSTYSEAKGLAFGIAQKIVYKVIQV
jgi:hypothetical protein